MDAATSDRRDAATVPGSPALGADVPDAAALQAARRVMAGAAHVADPVATAEIFPAEAYTGADFYRFERWALFEREWLCIGHVNQVPNPNDHVCVTIIDEKLIIARDQKGDLRVLSAICQHRGHPLLDGLAAPAAQHVCANAKLLICPYHAWSYRLDGTLHAAPKMRRSTEADELSARVRLPQIRHEIFHGLIFINFDAGAAPLAPRLARMHDMIAAYGLADLVPQETNVVPVRSNWKIYQENSLEPYHTDVVHRSSHDSAPADLSEFYPYAPGDGAVITTTGFATDAELFADEAAPALPGIPGLDAAQSGRLLFIAVLPTLFLLLEPGSALITLAFPLDADSMDLLTIALYTREATQAPGFAEAAAAQAKGLRTILGEDLLTQEALQRGHRSRYTPKGALSWLEATIPQMNSWLAERYAAALAEAEKARLF